MLYLEENPGLVAYRFTYQLTHHMQVWGEAEPHCVSITRGESVDMRSDADMSDGWTIWNQ